VTKTPLSETATVEDQQGFVIVHYDYEVVSEACAASWRVDELNRLDQEFSGSPATNPAGNVVMGRGQFESVSGGSFRNEPFSRVRPQR